MSSTDRKSDPLIPARAGSTRHVPPPVLCRPGSSPLARGAPPPLRALALDPRLIPARAGSTGRRGRRQGQLRAHPRSRGEHEDRPLLHTPYSGSSPLARGARRAHRVAAEDRGLIPARAGSTRRGAGRWAPCPAHPRSRGEHASATEMVLDLGGSSPLARGAHAIRPAVKRADRLIPARAGSTRRVGSWRPPRPAHPRSRGEHYLWDHSGERVPGSSPLARGAPRQRDPHPRSPRLIPARAGSTAP